MKDNLALNIFILSFLFRGAVALTNENSWSDSFIYAFFEVSIEVLIFSVTFYGVI